MKKRSIFIIVVLLFMLCAAPVYANGIPQLPNAFYGTVEINGGPASIGSTISAIGDGVEPNTLQNPVKTTQVGSYGIDSPKLLVQGEIADGAIITFYVNGDVATTDPATVEWHSEETTRVDLTVAEAEPVPTPTVVTNAASSLTTTSATLNGNLTGLGTASSVEVSFEWGTTDAYGNETPAQTVTIADPFTATLTGLSASTSYHFIARAVGDGTGYGVDRAFTTATPLAGGGGGGGGGGPILPAGTTDVRGMIGTGCSFYTRTTAYSEDRICTLTIPAGTVCLTEELECLSTITMLIMDDPPPPPKGANVIGLPYNFQPSGVTFDPPVTFTFTYDPADIPEGIAEEDLVLAYYDLEAGEWVTLECTVDPDTNTITALISHFTAFTILGYEVVPEAAAFTPSSLVISPTEVDICDTVNVSLSVANTSGIAGSYEVILKVNGAVEATQEVTVGAGASEEVTFTVSRCKAGSYSVDANGLSGSFTVKEEVAPAPPAPPPPAPPEVKPINWPVVGGLIAAVVLAGLLFFLIRRRRAL